MLLYFFYAGLIVLTGSALKIIIRRFDKNEIRVYLFIRCKALHIRFKPTLSIFKISV